MKDTDSVGSKEEQDTSVDNTCYLKLASTSWLYTTFSSLQVGYNHLSYNLPCLPNSTSSNFNIQNDTIY